MIQLILQVFWFFLPAGIANMAPVLFKWVPFLDYPVDFNVKLRNKPLFGRNKTFRGFAASIILAIIIVYIQKTLYARTEYLAFVDYSAVNVLLLGFLMGFGALLGDLVESFFKRRLSIAPGKNWVPFDQIDWILGAVACVYFYVDISWSLVLAAFVIFGLLHPVINLVGYFLHFKKKRF
ncbi:CDP-archaeol synthase [Candidatus Woesearchaeota archaeon]|nr:CDP-archaeol synthase [Candidatus Woesearchaeota archaeon]